MFIHRGTHAYLHMYLRVWIASAYFLALGIRQRFLHLIWRSPSWRLQRGAECL